MNEKKILIKYVRKGGRRSRPIGVVVSTGKGQVGWSLCHEENRWDKNVGKDIAITRAISGDLGEIPAKFKRPVEEMIDRSNRFFYK